MVQREVATEGKNVHDVKVGDIVVFGQYAGNDTIDVEGEELIILSESDIKAVVEG